MASQYLLMIDNFDDDDDVLEILRDKNFLSHQLYKHGDIKLSIRDHIFAYNRDPFNDNAHLARIAYVSTNIFSEATNVSCLKAALGEDIQFTLYMNVTQLKGICLLPTCFDDKVNGRK